MYNTVVTKDFVSLYIEGYKLPKKELHLSKEREVDIYCWGLFVFTRLAITKFRMNQIDTQNGESILTDYNSRIVSILRQILRSQRSSD